MGDFLGNMDLIYNFFILCVRQIFGLYTSYPVFMAVFTLWVLDRIFGIFDLIKG